MPYARTYVHRVLDTLPCGVLLMQRDTGGVYANSKARDILGGDWDSLGAGTKAILEYHFLRALDGTPDEEDPEKECGFTTNEGAIHYIRCSAASVLDECGNIESAAVCLMTDVTRQHHPSGERLRADRLRELFVGALGHDLRNPLSVILASASHLLRRGTLHPEHARSLERVVSSGRRMGRMIEQMLDLTRVRLAGGIPLFRRQTDLTAVVSAIVDDARSLHPDCTLIYQPKDRVLGTWDPDRITQVVHTLLCNAISHGDRQRPIRVELRPLHARVHLSVQNDGEPIESDPDELFDPFRQDAKGSHSDGLGLGLFISREIVRAHGGDMHVTSSRSAGTLFEIALPFSLAARESSPALLNHSE